MIVSEKWVIYLGDTIKTYSGRTFYSEDIELIKWRRLKLIKKL